MAKSKKSRKSPYAETAVLLNRIQERIDAIQVRVTAVGAESARTTDSLAALLGRERLIQAKVSDVENSAGLQKSYNKGVTESLYALRDSTMKSFDNLASDMKSALTTIQRLNERIGQLESKAKYDEEKLKAVYATVQSLFAFPEIKGTDGFGEFTYIHPLDLAELMESTKVSDVISYSGDGKSERTLVTIGKTRYMQSAFVPRRPGKHKIV